VFQSSSTSAYLKFSWDWWKLGPEQTVGTWMLRHPSQLTIDGFRYLSVWPLSMGKEAGTFFPFTVII